MAYFSVPAGTARSRTTISEFKGVDLHNAPANVSLNRSPDAPNMIRDVPGKVRKRCGYHLVRRFPGASSGVFPCGGRGRALPLSTGGPLFIPRTG